MAQVYRSCLKIHGSNFPDRREKPHKWHLFQNQFGLIFFYFFLFLCGLPALACPLAWTPKSSPAKNTRPPSGEEVRKDLLPSQKTAFSAYEKALRSKAKSFLHIAPLSDSRLMAHALMERLIKTKKRGSNIAIVVVSRTQWIDPLLDVMKKTAEEYSAIMNIDVMSWHRNISSDLAGSDSAGSAVMMTFQQLKQILRNPDSESYELLLPSLSAVFMHLTPPLERELIGDIALSLQEKSSAFVYGQSGTSLHPSNSLSHLFEKTHYSYLNTEKDLFQDPAVSDPVKGLLRQFSLGVQQGELTHFKGPAFMDLSKAQIPNRPLFVFENQRKVLNPFYYLELVNRLSVVFKLHSRGVLLTGTKASAENLSSVLNSIFPDRNFDPYHYGLSAEERQDILMDSRESKYHYIVAVRSFDEVVRLPHLSVLIDLNVHAPVRDRLEMAGPVLSLYPGKQESQIIFLLDSETAEANGFVAHKAESSSKPGVDNEKNNFDQRQSPALPVPTQSEGFQLGDRTDTKMATAVKKKVRGKGRVQKFLPWAEALAKVRKARLKSAREYYRWQKAHPDMYSHPPQYPPYAEHWIDWPHFLGKAG